MARYVMVLRRATSLRGALEGDPEKPTPEPGVKQVPDPESATLVLAHTKLAESRQ